MKIIGHRGAAGLALENTLPSIELARLLGVDAIEFDVRITKDRQLVLAHDDDLFRVSGKHLKISNSTLAQVQEITLSDEQSKVPTLEEALEAAGTIPVIIEIKATGYLSELLETMSNLPGTKFTVVSRKHNEIAKLKKLRPDIKAYLVEDTKATEIVQIARRTKADGLDLNYWILNPLTYFLARRYKLEIMVFTVNSRILASFIKFLYPHVAICTNHPEWFIKHPWLKLRSSSKEESIKKKTVKKPKRKPVI